MKTYEKVIIYYFTGTGNALNVAKWFKDVAVDRKMDCQIVNISKISSFPLITLRLMHLLFLFHQFMGLIIHPIW